MKIHAAKGFTLVELSIVLVIIGLLIGGVLVGQSLIESAKINSQVQQIQQYDSAINNYHTKYNCLPADCAKVQYRLYNGGYGAGTYTMVNGDGNKIYSHHPSLANFMGQETMMFFPALSQSEMIKENYTNCNGSYNCTGAAAPAGNWSGLIGKGGMWPETKLAPKKGLAMVGGLNNGLYYFLGLDISAMCYYHWISPNGIIPAAQAAAFDQKLDDGFASTGKVYASTNRETVNSSCGSVCAGYNDSTVMQLDTTNGACTNNGTPRAYNVNSANLCRLVVASQSVANN